MNTIDPPAAKKGKEGNLVIVREALETLYLETYKDRFKPNPLEEFKTLKEYLCEIQIKLAKSNVSKEWSLDDLHKALKSFENNKARDKHGLTYELRPEEMPS